MHSALRRSLHTLLGDTVPAQHRDVVATGLVLNSADVSDGDIFVALKGARSDGVQFISAAKKSGAIAVLIDANRDDVGHFTLAQDDGVPIIAVTNLDQQLGRLAAKFYGFPTADMNVVGITGTNGKSTCTTWLSQLWLLLGKKSAVIGTLGYGLAGHALESTGMTTPSAIECQRIMAQLHTLSVDAAAMEVSSHAIAQHRISGIDFDVAAFTNLSRDHLDFHGSMENYAATKMAFVERDDIPCAVINIDDRYGAEVYEKSKTAKNKTISRSYYSYSLRNVNADIYATDVLFHEKGTSAIIVSIWGRADIHLSIIGEFNLSNMLAVIAIACAQGEVFLDVIAACGKLTPVSGRMQPVNTEHQHADDIVAYIDYAHTPDALEKALTTLKHHVENNLWLVFGCGGDRDKGKRPLMGEKAVQYADHIVVTSDNPRTENPVHIIDDIVCGVANQDKVVVCPDRKEAICYAIHHALSGDCILIAGKGHEDYQIIGDQRHLFDDAEVAALAMQDRFSTNHERPLA